jgi:hypothetical protein
LFNIDLFNAPAGSGKTYGLVTKISNLASDQHYILVCQPTIKLVEDTASSLELRYPEVPLKVIHGENTKGSIKALNSYLLTGGPKAQVVFITQTAFDRMASDFRKGDWHLIVDEIPQIADVYTKALTINHNVISNFIKIVEGAAPYAKLEITNASKLREIAQNKKKDAVWAILQPLANRLLSKHWESYVLRSSYENLLKGTGVDKQLTVFFLMKPTVFDGFASVTIAGACAKETLLVQCWSKLGIEFRDVKDLPLRYDTHQNGQELTISFAFDELWSKSLANKNEGKVLKAMEAAVRHEFESDPFLWSANKGAEGLFEGSGNACQLPHAPHGLNEYQVYSNVAVQRFIGFNSLSFLHVGR